MENEEKILDNTQNNFEGIEEHTLTDDDMRNIANSIMQNNYEMIEPKIIDSNIFNDLEIFNSNDNEQSPIFNRINHTNTFIGSEYLKQILQNPTDNKDFLIERRTNIIKITNNNQLLQFLSEKLKIIKDLEKDVFWFYDKHEPEVNEWYNNAYFRNWILKPLNNIKNALNIRTKYLTLISPIMYIISPLISIIIAYISLRLMGISVSLFRFLNIARISAQMTPQLLANIGILPRAIMHLKKLGPYLWFFLYFQGVYSIVSSALELNKINKKIHEKVRGVINYLKETVNLMNELEKYGFKFSSKTKIEQFLVNKKVDDYSLIFDQGHYLINFKKISLSQDDITKVIIDIGNIDSLFSISKLLLLSHLPFTTANYSDNNKISCKGMFHPSIGFNNSIKNDINFDGNVIITGPNGSGKSTIVKGIGLCVLFSHTITLVNAEYANIPIFSYINTYLNIPDCQGKESLFQAELRRCLYNINRIQSLSPNKKSFLLMDEIFTGTNFKEGLSAAYSICKHLTNITNNLTLITTHYKLLTTIEKKFPWPNGYKNFKMVLNKGNIYTYSLKEGISEVMMAIDMMESYGFPENVVKDARLIVKKLNKRKYI